MSDLTFRWLFQQSELGLRRLVGTNTEQRTFTTVHVSELRNPAEFTLPGAIIMLVGLDFVDKRGEFATYVRVLADAGVAGIGFGTGIAFASVPEELVDAAAQHDLVLCEVPRPTPFLSVMSAVSREQTRREQERQTVLRKQQEKLSAAAWRGGLDDVCRVGARELAAAVAVVGESGEVWAQAGGAMGLRGARMQQKIELPGRVAAMLVVEAAGKFDAYARALIKHLAGLAGLLVHRSAQDHAGPAEALGALVLSTLLAGEVRGVRETSGDRAEAGPAGSTAVSRQRDLLADAMDLVASRGEVVFAGLVADRSDELAATITAYVQGAGAASHRSAARSGDGARYVLRLSDTQALLVSHPEDRLPAPQELAQDFPACATARLALQRRQWRGFGQVDCDRLLVHAGALAPGSVAEWRETTPAWLRVPGVDAALRRRRQELLAGVYAQALGDEQAEQLIATLRVYLLNSCNVGATADALGIHRHTVRSRIARVKQCAGFDLEDPLARAELVLVLAG
ncbi:PucR family transcriptional regulator [Corynebacterium propinquum]|uniref:PucR family transcriptional regulator n=1 Tax=Corynebacterium propinquum TaxID=43769 RepID=UPI00266F0853|nr:PucR family transcriptional regulator [Corynebacterium propinquum]WKS27975.1 PucR family transcriptional regulator [Corynebacterium propinquum]